jgi:hypothetical protein
VEQFYGHEKEYETFIDYNRKAGPLSHMRTQLQAEANRIENGGSGIGEKAIIPTRKRNDIPDAPPVGRPSRAPEFVPAGPGPGASEGGAGGAGEAAPPPAGEAPPPRDSRMETPPPQPGR